MPTLDDHATGTFTVRLRFAGLCLFVPEPAGGLNPQGELAAVHVLLMNAGDDTPMHGWSRPLPCTHHGHHLGGFGPHPKHYSMLYVDGRHLASERQPTNRVVGIPLKDTRLVLPGTGGGITHQEPLSHAIIALHEITDVGRLPRKWINEKPDRQVAAQVVVTAGEPGQHPTGARVRIQKGVEPSKDDEVWQWSVASEVEWVIPNVGPPPFKLALQHIDTREQKGSPLELYPVGGEIRLSICCLPLYELPGAAPGRPAEVNEPVEHFDAFFSVFPGVTAPTLILTELEKTTGTSVCTAAWVALAEG